MAYRVTYEQIIAGARFKLQDGEQCIANVPRPFRATWWPSRPVFEQQLVSDYGMPGSVPVLEKCLYDELAAIRETLKEQGHSPSLAGWPTNSTGAARRMMMGLNAQADALTIWDEIAVPIRRRGHLVHRILAPREVMGSPIIDALDVDQYIRGASAKTAEDAARITDLTRRLSQWRLASFIPGAFSAVLIVWKFAA